MAILSGRKGIFSGRLAKIRMKRKLSQSQLATMTGMNKAAISHYETGHRSPTLDNLASIGMALKVSLDYLLGTSNDTMSPQRWHTYPKKFEELSHINQKVILKIIDLFHKHENL